MLQLLQCTLSPQAANMGTETGMFPDPEGPDRREQTWDNFVNKTGKEKGAKVS